MTAGPALVSILRQGSYLIASIHTALDDAQLVRFQQDLVQQIGVHRSLIWLPQGPRDEVLAALDRYAEFV